MKFTEIKSEEEYKLATLYIEELGDREDFEDTPELIEEFEFIANLIDEYDTKHFPIKEGNPIEIIKLAMEYKGLKQKDLYHIRSKGIISAILNKRRAMSKDVIREFSTFFSLDQKVLNVEYKLTESTKKKKQRTNKKISFDFNQTTKNRITYFQNRIRKTGMSFNVYTN